MKPFFFIVLIFLNFTVFAAEINVLHLGKESVILSEKKLVAIYDGFDGETYNFIGVDQYGEEFFFIVNKVDASVLSGFDLKSEDFKNAKFEVYYKEEATGDAGNTIITVTKLIKI